MASIFRRVFRPYSSRILLNLVPRLGRGPGVRGEMGRSNWHGCGPRPLGRTISLPFRLKIKASTAGELPAVCPKFLSFIVNRRPTAQFQIANHRAAPPPRPALSLRLWYLFAPPSYGHDDAFWARGSLLTTVSGHQQRRPSTVLYIHTRLPGGSVHAGPVTC